MLKIGITGGIGTGKSTVCKIFKALEIPVFDADKEAKLLYNEMHVKSFITNTFGHFIYDEHGFQKDKLAEIVFRDAGKLKLLNTFLHPLVFEQSEKWFTQQKTPYALKEAAILIESGAYKKVDQVILVQAPLQCRIDRIASRDGMHVEEIKQRIDRQLDEKEKEAYADYIIHNSPTDLLIPQVLTIHAKILSRCDN